MIRPMHRLRRFVAGLILLGAAQSGIRAAEVAAGAYRGWPGAWTLDNGVVQAVVVPEVGRVMQFGFKGEEGVFWENPDLAGKPMPEQPWSTPGSFGGDKTWPAPQSAWDWPPPDVFDRQALDGMPDGRGGFLLVSPASPKFGIRTERRITLDDGRPVMRIVTTYQKVQGDPVQVAVWVISQLKDPEKVFLPIPAKSLFKGGLATTWDWPSPFLRFAFRRVAMERDPKVGHKIGNDASRMLWVGKSASLMIECPRETEGTYPDGGCSAEVYTNGDPAKYVELETLGPLRTLSLGDSISATNTYTLHRRRKPTPEAEATALLR
jgi:hypothetical protein